MEELLKHCSAYFSGAFSGSGNLFAVFFLAGLTGGFTHCLPMCGSLVAGSAATCRAACAKNCSKVALFSRSSEISYHLGRATTYGALGFFAAFLSKQIAAFPFWHVLSAAMLALAGCLFIFTNILSCKHNLLKKSGKNKYLRGILLGFIPCNMLYAALMMAATTANPVFGMFAMWLFVLGTIPALLVASVSAGMASAKWQGTVQKVGRVVMVCNGVSLLVMAGRMVI